MKRANKTITEWKKQYKEKHSLMMERGYEEVSPHDFYRELFPKGSLQETEGDGKGNIIATQVRPKGQGRTRQWIVGDDLKMLDKVVGDRFGLVPPISFYGKTHTIQNAHELYAFVIDIDYVGKQQLKNLLKQFGNGVQLRPTFLVSSGKGVHVYYFLKEPLPLYHNLADMLKELKEAMIRRLWNDTSSIRPDDPDLTGIYQGFRCVGSQSKLGADYPVRAYRLSENRYTLEDIKNAIPFCEVDVSIVTEKPKPPKKRGLTLEKAKELYPEWYEKKIIKGEPAKRYTTNIAAYEWWKRKIMNDVKAGGRYFSIMALCAFGLKCGVSEWQIRRDAYSFIDHLESLTEDEDNHFKRSDVTDALQALKANKKDLTFMSTREWIEKQTKVVIPPTHREKGKRLKQAQHLELARYAQKIRDPDGEWRNKDGAPSKEQIVRAWREAHPDGRKIDCERETGLSRHTVLKWW
ncbi:MAG: repa [Lachnospiraceae bacterium]|nr:repa [Lachnospiraceae bacterium]